MTETHNFSADLNQLMSLIVNTFYSNHDIFLREIISNSTDALDKIRYLSLTDSEVLKGKEELHIEIIPDKEAKTLTIQDTGIGMTKQDLITNLGIIAKSGTKEFMEKLKNSKDLSLIGQFGCGVYSAFLVADRVQYISKHNDDECYMWESSASGTFTISKLENNVHRGTKVILYLKNDKLEYLDERKIKDLIKRHSEYAGYNIFLLVSKTTEREVSDNEEELEDNIEDLQTKEEDLQTKEEDLQTKEEDLPPSDDPIIEEPRPNRKTKKITETKNEMELLNSIRPLWNKNPKDVSDEEYQVFYKNISKDWQDSLGVKHFKIEGQIEYRAILYCPRNAPFDLFDRVGKQRNNIKLYVKGVFITDEVDDLIPEWLKFIQGVVDSEDLPLNISRENLQQNKIMGMIKKNIIKKCLELFKEIAEDKDRFDIFFKQFSKSIKLGIHEDSTHRNTLSEFLRYKSSKSNGELTSFSEYVSRMKESQNDIYFITGDNIENSPFLEQFRKRELEVLYLAEPLDEYVVQQIRDYNDKKLVCITKGNIKFEDDEDMEKINTEYKDLCDFVKTYLGEKVEKVILSNRLIDTSCVLSTSQHGWSSHMEKIMKLQALRNTEVNQYMISKKTLEFNPNHKIIIHINNEFKKDNNSSSVKSLIDILYQSALLSSGFDLDNPTEFVKRLNNIIEDGLDN